MRVLVCGSRDWADAAAIRVRLSALPGEQEEIVVIHGACSRRDPETGREVSADMLADRAAEAFGFTTRRYPADWERDGRGAGFVRNVLMLEQERPDLVVAFQRNGSRGTQHTIDEARRRGIPVEVHTA